jgi:uncharacterized protein with NRDE domain
MCTLIVLHRLVPGTPLVVAANRDEYLDRPSEGPALRTTAFGPVVAPSDLRAGGTWLGLNAEGVFAAVTNLRCPEPDPDRRSRGLLVMDALSKGSAAESVAALRALPERAYNPFNLLIADSREAFLLSYRETPKIHGLEPGAHVVGNTDPEDREAPKVKRIRERAEKVAQHLRPSLLDDLAAVCSEHDSPESPLGDTCVHAAAYGTRSSTLLSLGDESFSDAVSETSTSSTLLYSDGPPCRTQYLDFTPLLTELSPSC